MARVGRTWLGWVTCAPYFGCKDGKGLLTVLGSPPPLVPQPVLSQMKQVTCSIAYARQEKKKPRPPERYHGSAACSELVRLEPGWPGSRVRADLGASHSLMVQMGAESVTEKA